MSFSTVLSAAVEGLHVEIVSVEADISNGLPVFHMVGYLSSEVKEAGERVRTAIRNSGFVFPPKRTVVNLSPATMRKRGASFDLPIAVSVLASLDAVPASAIRKCLIIGELGLDGRTRKVPGILPMVMEAKKRGITQCIVPKENTAEALLVKGVAVIGAASLQETVSYLTMQPEEKEKIIRENQSIFNDQDRRDELNRNENRIPDFSELQGQENVRRAAEIAVAGGHNLLMIGPPGSGKSMTAGCIAGILPPLTEKESMEITKIYSVLGLVDERTPLITQRPFRTVHHTATRAALIGGGLIPRPGEISLAHGGVLFLDELPEFQKSVLEVLRQPLEERSIQISRACGNYRFPANFMLVAAMNPCPCGCYPDKERCTCTPLQIRSYLGKISRPFLDRVDLCVEVSKVDYKNLVSADVQESSEDIRKRIIRVRRIQEKRYAGTEIASNAMLGGRTLNIYCRLGVREKRIMEQAFDFLNLTARGYHRVLKIARTIADLEEEADIRESHLKEALSYRMIDDKYWRR